MNKLKMAILGGVLCSVFFLSCKKHINEDTNISSGSSSALTMDDIGTLVHNFYSSLKTGEPRTDSLSWSVDSAEFYLEGSLNFKFGYADANLSPHAVYEADFFMNTYTGNVTYNSILGSYNTLSTFIQTSFAQCSLSNKLIHSINIEKTLLPVNNGRAMVYEGIQGNTIKMHISLLIGNGTACSGSATASATPSYYSSLSSWRYNYNGGNCNQTYTTYENPIRSNYYAPDDYGKPHLGRWEEPHTYPGCKLGFDDGGARELEGGVLALYSYRDAWSGGTAPRYPHSVIVGIGSVGTGRVGDNWIYPSDYPLTSSPISGSTYFNSSMIYSFNQWSMYNNDNFPCITGDQLNVFLGYTYDIASDLRPSDKYLHSIDVYSGYIEHDPVNSKPGTDQCNLRTYYGRGAIGQTFDSYYDHQYAVYFGYRVQDRWPE